MRSFLAGGRLTAALVSVCVGVGASIAPASAIIPVQTGDPGGGTTCKSCETQHQTNQTAGSATGGSVTNNPDSSGSQWDMTYDLPNDGQQYSGYLMTQVELPDGTVSVQTFPTSWTSVGGSGYATAWNNAAVPIGGTGSISISATAPSGATFSAGFVVHNYGQ